MSIKFRLLPKPVIALVVVGLLFLWLTFITGPLYNMVTNKIAYGRVVHASTSDSTVLVDNKFYPFVNKCAGTRDGLCDYPEGKSAFFLVSSPDKIGYRLDEMLKQIGIGLLGTLVLAAVCLELRIKKTAAPAPTRHYSPHHQPQPLEPATQATAPTHHTPPTQPPSPPSQMV